MPDKPQGGSSSGRSGGSGEGQTGGTENSPAGGTGTGNTGNTGAGNDANSPFDPAEIYWVGDAKKEDGKSFLTPIGLASMTAPTEGIYGFNIKTGGRIWGDKLIYARPGKIFQLKPDNGKTADPEKNDLQLPTPPCDDDVIAFVPTPDGRLFYTCSPQKDSWYEDGVLVHEHGDIWAVGNDGHLLLPDLAWGELGSEESTPTVGLPIDLGPLQARASGGGFHVLFGDALGQRRELWSIENAEATQLGVYTLPNVVTLKRDTLGADDLLYWVVETDDGYGGIVTTSIDGDTVLIHEDSGDDFPIALDPHPLIDVPTFTGP